MVSSPALQWLLTVAFSATMLFSALQLSRTRRPVPLVGDALHLVMSAGMIAMCWPWWGYVPAAPQLILFIFGTTWFLSLLFLQLAQRIQRVAVGGHRAWHQAAHAIMMLAMVWMIVAMPAGSDTADHAHHHDALPLWASLSGVAITASLLVFGIVFLVDVIGSIRNRATWLGHTGEAAAGAVMSLGMAAMCWPMITG